MDPLTLGLIAATAVLIIGNAALEATKSDKKGIPKKEVRTTALTTQNTQPLSSNSATTPELTLAHLTAANQKIMLINDRLHRVESILAQIPLDALKQRFDLIELQNKIERLTEFKQSAEIELVAIRDALAEKGILRKKENNSDSNWLEREIKSRVFNSKKK